MKLILYSVVTLAVLLSAQQPPVGAGILSGIVIQAGTDRPIDGVQILITPASTTPGKPPVDPVGAVTNLVGRFEVGNIPAGRYRIQWTRPGYFTPPVSMSGPDSAVIQNLKRQLGLDSLFIASPPASTSVTVDIAPGEIFRGFVFALIPGGVISGRIWDPAGRPLVNASLTALTVNYEDGHRVLRPGGAITTSDDRGEFRLFGLRPGEYFVRADYRPAASPSAPLVRNYFPGVLETAGATPIIVSESGESPGVDIRVSDRGNVSVLGRITTPENVPPAAAQFYLFPAGSDVLEDPSAVSIPNSAQSENRAMGEFELRGVPPGQYSLVATLFDSARTRTYIGRASVSIGGQDYRNLSVDLHPPADLKGRVILEDGSPARQSLTLRPRETQAISGRLPGRIDSNADGSFIIPQAPEARYSLTLSSNEVCVVDIHQGGRSVYDDGFTGGAGAEPITVIVSNPCGTVQVQIVDDKQQPVSNAFVSLIPSGDHRRNPLLYKRSIFDVAGSRYPPIPAIPPGQYSVFAWDNIPPNAELNAGFLSKFENRGVTVTLRNGDSLTVQVPLIRTKD